MKTKFRGEYGFQSDPGHGWLVVPRKELQALGIEDKISSFSYQGGDKIWAYLEEDQDAGIFIQAFKAKFGKDPIIEECRQHPKEHWIRRLQPFQT